MALSFLNTKKLIQRFKAEGYTRNQTFYGRGKTVVLDVNKVRVDTFTSNQRFRMNDKRILTGISKADVMVNAIKEAKKNSSKKK